MYQHIKLKKPMNVFWGLRSALINITVSGLAQFPNFNSQKVTLKPLTEC